MAGTLDALLILVFLLDIAMLGTSRISAVIRAVAVQGVLLGLMPVLVHGRLDPEALLVGAGTIGLKGVVIPLLLARAVREVHIRREVEPLVGYGASMLLGSAGAGLALLFSRFVPVAPGEEAGLLVPASLATVLTGFLLLTTRLKAVNQVLGYLVLENGVFIFGLLLLKAVPLLVEVGVLLDLVVATFVMGIILDHIRREFSSVDTRDLSSLREE